jgi:peptidoglycan hydrolase-like protein with peptidoglycan-binding domain
MTPRRARTGHAPRAIPIRIGSGVAALAASTGLLATTAADAFGQTDTPLLTQGSKGAAVSHLQQKLHIARTGRFDRTTKRAVIRYQRRDSLLVDGIVGPQTWDSLLGIKPTTTSTAASTSSAPTSSTGGYSIPSGIVQCESGGNYSAVNPSSGAGGAYQILPSTWQAYGGQGLPQDAPKSEQDAIAGKIYAAQGGSAWSC